MTPQEAIEFDKKHKRKFRLPSLNQIFIIIYVIVIIAYSIWALGLQAVTPQ